MTPTASVQHLAWLHAGAPATPTGVSATCSGCHRRTTDATLTADVVSAKFTGWDQHLPASAAEPHWCPTCVWVHTDPALRTEARLVTASASGTPTAPELALLLRAPLAPDTALILPRGKRKHIAPTARWGHVTSDEGPVAWTAHDAARFTRLLDLRLHRFTDADLRREAPPAERMLALPRDAQVQVWNDWPTLREWRRHATTFEIALTASRGAT